MRCRGYKKKPSIVYTRGEAVGRLWMYGLGKCPECGRVIATAPKSGTMVMHKMMPQPNDLGGE